MTDLIRTINPERAGGIGDAAVNGPRGAGSMSVEDAEEHVERLLGWRTVLGRSDQAALALLREVRKLRAALPEVIGCAHGDALHCARDPLDGGACCENRIRLIEDGLLPQPERQDEEDGA